MFDLHSLFDVLLGRRRTRVRSRWCVACDRRHCAAMVLGLILWTTTGCAVHYYDPKTGAEHIWGVGHLVMKVSAPDEGVRAIVRSSETIGVTLSNRDGPAVTMGWEKWQQLEIVDANTAIRLERPQGDFVNIRVGSGVRASSRPGTRPETVWTWTG